MNNDNSGLKRASCELWAASCEQGEIFFRIAMPWSDRSPDW